MNQESVQIPKKEYDLLIKCRSLVRSEFEERFSKKFVKDVKTSEQAYKKGDFLNFESAKEAKKYFDTAF